MTGECGTGHYKGQKHYYYKCSGAKRHICSNSKGIKKEWIEKLSILSTMDVLLTDKTVARIADKIYSMQDMESPAITALRNQLSDCEKRITNLMKAIEEGLATPTTVARLKELEETRNDLSYSISQLKLKEHRMSKFEIASRINRYRFSEIDDKEFQKEIIGSFINSIFCYEDRFVFTYNSKGKAKVLTLDEIQKAFASQLKNPAPNRNIIFLVFLKDTFGFTISKESLDEIDLKKTSYSSTSQ